MTIQTIYIAADGTRFLDKDICLEYEAERIKFPTEPGIRFYNRSGNEINIEHIEEMELYEVTNTIIAKAMLNKIKMYILKHHYPLFTKCGYYMLTTTGFFRIEKDLFDETISRIKSQYYI